MAWFFSHFPIQIYRIWTFDDKTLSNLFPSVSKMEINEAFSLILLLWAGKSFQIQFKFNSETLQFTVMMRVSNLTNTSSCVDWNKNIELQFSEIYLRPLRSSPKEGNGNPLPSSWQDNLMDRGPWLLQFMGLQKSQTRLNDRALEFYSSIHFQLRKWGRIWDSGGLVFQIVYF